MTKNEALRMGMDALVSVLANHKGAPVVPWNDALDAMEIALEVKDEPVAWISATELLVMRGNALGGAKDWRVNLGLEPEEGDVGLYTTPPQRTWVGLTDEEIDDLSRTMVKGNKSVNWLCQAIEAKLKEKNEQTKDT
ncbi:hypothetical protein CCP3SC15_260030 [Gammaproteobacteria bacterium]